MGIVPAIPLGGVPEGSGIVKDGGPVKDGGIVKDEKLKRGYTRPGLSQDARRRMGEAGFKNLQQYKARTNTRVQELEAEVSAFRDGLLRDAGANLTTTKRGLVEAATSTYAGVLKMRHALIRSRKSNVGELSERMSFLAGNLCRILKAMGLDTRPKPTGRWCLDDLKPLETVEKGTV